MWAVQGWWCPCRSQGLMLPLYCSAIFKTSRHPVCIPVSGEEEENKVTYLHCKNRSQKLHLRFSINSIAARHTCQKGWKLYVFYMPCVQVKSRGSIKRKRKWILGYYQQYMPFKLIQKLYVQSHQEKRKGKFGLCFLLET